MQWVGGSRPEKNVDLLIATLESFLGHDRDARAVIAGSGAARLQRVRSSRIERVGQVERQRLAEIAARARVCLITSRWESFHNGGHEALAAGATVVGTPIPVVYSMTCDGRYGTIAKSHRVRSLQAALVGEMSAWDLGERKAVAIASDWRARLAPSAVASQLAALVA